MISKTRKLKLKKNIWKFYLYRVFTSMFFIMPIFILFLQENGMSMTQITFLEAAYTFTIMLTIIPFGIAADYIGKKKILVANAFFFALGWAVYAAGNNFWQFMAAELILAISTSLWESSKEPFLYDTLKELKQEGRFKKTYGKVVGINSIMFGIAALIGSYLAGYSLRLPLLVMIIPMTIALIITFSFTETKIYKHKKNYVKHLKDSAGFAVKHPKIRLFIFYSAILWTVITAGFIFYQPYLKSINIPIVFFGLIYAVIGCAAAVGGRTADKIEKKLGEKKILLFLILLLILSFVGMSKVTWILGLIFPIIIGFVEGLFQPVIADYFHKHVESHHRATVSSINRLSTKGFIAALIPFFGWMADVYSLNMAFRIAAAILIMDIFILSLVYVIGWRRLRNGEKEIV